MSYGYRVEIWVPVTKQVTKTTKTVSTTKVGEVKWRGRKVQLVFWQWLDVFTGNLEGKTRRVLWHLIKARCAKIRTDVKVQIRIWDMESLEDLLHYHEVLPYSKRRFKKDPRWDPAIRLFQRMGCLGHQEEEAAQPASE